MKIAAERRLHNLHRQLATPSVLETGLERMETLGGNAQSIWQSIPQVYPEPSWRLLSVYVYYLSHLKSRSAHLVAEKDYCWSSQTAILIRNLSLSDIASVIGLMVLVDVNKSEEHLTRVLAWRFTILVR